MASTDEKNFLSKLDELQEYIKKDDFKGLRDSKLLNSIHIHYKIDLIALSAFMGAFKCIDEIIESDKKIINYPIKTSSKSERNVDMEEIINNNVAADALGDGMTVSLVTQLLYPGTTALKICSPIKGYGHLVGDNNLLILEELDKKYNFIKLDKYYKIGVSYHFIEKVAESPRNNILSDEKCIYRKDNTNQCPETFNIFGIMFQHIDNLANRYCNAKREKGYEEVILIRNNMVSIYSFMIYLCEKFRKEDGFNINKCIVEKDTHYSKEISQYTGKSLIEKIKGTINNTPEEFSNIVNNILDLFN